jgi:hypothetical protein
MKKDADIISDAYENTVKSLFSTFFTSSLSASAKGDKEALKKAEDSFRKGLNLARQSREVAVRIAEKTPADLEVS